MCVGGGKTVNHYSFLQRHFCWSFPNICFIVHLSCDVFQHSQYSISLSMLIGPKGPSTITGQIKVTYWLLIGPEGNCITYWRWHVCCCCSHVCDSYTSRNLSRIWVQMVKAWNQVLVVSVEFLQEVHEISHPGTLNWPCFWYIISVLARDLVAVVLMVSFSN